MDPKQNQHKRALKWGAPNPILQDDVRKIWKAPAGLLQGHRKGSVRPSASLRDDGCDNDAEEPRAVRTQGLSEELGAKLFILLALRALKSRHATV